MKPSLQKFKIAKFGGSSVGTPERVAKVAQIIQAHPDYALVVVSAFEGVTNELIKISELAARRDDSYKARFNNLVDRHIKAAEALLPPKLQSSALVKLKLWLNELEEALQGVFLVRELSKHSLDFISSFGERFSAFTLSECLRAQDFPAYFVDARQWIKTNDNFGFAKVDFATTNQIISNQFDRKAGVAIITGFIGSTDQGETTTLGRGGSDYSAAIIGAALNVEEIAIWTDVDGMLTADPRKVSKAFSLHSLSYEEAMELCHFGAKVIYPPTLQPALDREIPIRIVNTFKPDFEGTLICSKPMPHSYPVTGISSIDKVSLLRVEGNGLIGVAGISGRLFSALAAAQVSVILISQASSEHSICFAVTPQDAVAARAAIDQCFSLEIKAGLMVPAIVEEGCSIVSLVGENMRRMPGISAKLFRALGSNGINVIAIAQGSSELNISVVISNADEVKALNAIHDAFFLSQVKALNLFILGTGLIGSTLIKQIAKQAGYLREELSLELRIVGLANSKHRLFSESGIVADQSLQLLEESSQPQDIKQFVAQMKRLNLPSSILVDCTASQEVASCYSEVLDRSIAIVTPNKRAQSDSMQRYKEIQAAARRRGKQILYETSVGAGLPVINTLHDLILSGDKILKIEAVLSGTLSFLFNSFCADPTSKFSDLVLQAKQKGFTEPDPRDDLNGLDVARKILILARESGLVLELKDIQITPLLPDSLFKAASVELFLKRLVEVDTDFDAKRQAAAKRNAKLCVMASLDNTVWPAVAGLSLREVGTDHPFHSLSGSDNIISFTTERYSDRPLVVKGPGAGAEVTAAGVFADIIRLAAHD